MHLWLSVAIIVLSADAVDTTKIEQANERAARVMDRIQSEGASWTARQFFPGGALDVRVERYPSAERFEIGAVVNGKTHRIVTVTQTDGYWYVDDGENRRRYRPYEAPLPLPTGVFLYSRSTIVPCIKEVIGPDDVVSIELVNRNRMLVRKRLTDEQRRHFEAVLEKLEGYATEIEARGSQVPPEPLAQMKEIKGWFIKGMPFAVDPESGIVLEMGQAPKEIHYLNFAWAKTDKAPWKIKADEWEDHSQALALDDLKDLIQIGHDPTFEPGGKSGDSEAMLLNVRTGEVRRLPYPFGIAMTGCFSADRTQAFVPGTVSGGDGSISLFKVDLRSGETELVGDRSLRHGMWYGPIMSPDGKRIAIANTLQGVALQLQLYVVDIQSKKATQVGKPLDTRLIAWHPNGESLLLELRELDPKTKAVSRFIGEMTLDGKTRKIREGSQAQLLPKSRRLMFETGKERTWQTCDLDGNDTKLLGDGLPGFGFAAPSPDGRLVMMKFERGKAPQPHLVDLQTGAAAIIKVPPGLWALPRWQ